MKTEELIDHIRSSAQLAAILEVSGWPKPGNVHRTSDHPEAHYEHFLAGSVALGSAVEAAARRGVSASKSEIRLSEIGVGELVKKAVSDVAKFHSGGNTHLGMCLLFVPLAAAAAKTWVETGDVQASSLSRNVDDVMRATTTEDARAVYDAIAVTGSASGLGGLSEKKIPDVHDKKAGERIFREELTLFKVMQVSSAYDTVAKELVTRMEISFRIGYKELMDSYKDTKNVNIAIVHTFLRMLSKIPDTFIARKVGLRKVNDAEKAVEIGMKEAVWVSETAEQVLGLGGLSTEEGKEALWRFDRKLRNIGKDYSPGTTADLTATALMIALLCGWRF